MKHILLIALAFFTLNVTAQEQKPEKRQGDRKERPQRMQKFADFTTEEMAQLKTKKMTLNFDLTEAQQKEIYKLNLKEATERKQMMEERKAKMEERRNNKGEGEKGKNKPSKEERLKIANDKLDKQISHKKEMKRILNKDQFEKWEKVNKRMQGKKQQKSKAKSSKKGKRDSNREFRKRQ